MTKPSMQERCTRWLVLLTLLHTVPVLWITPVSAATMPTVALLAYGFASLFTFEREGAALALFALGPALAYCAIGWALAWLVGRMLRNVQRVLRTAVLGALVVGPLLSVYWPVYVAGGHTGSRSADLFALFANTIDPKLLLGYRIVLHVVLAGLFASHLLRGDHPLLTFAERWRKRALAGTAVAIVAAFLYGNYPTLVCRPLAELGSGRAALCVARSDRREQHYFYELAAERGQPEAILWMIEHTSDQERKLYWLRKGAEAGDGAIQFALYERLRRFGNDAERTEAQRWLRGAAEADHAPAQLALVETLSNEIYRTRSTELVPEHNAWLERAASHGARTAKLRLAQHYLDGSMGYAADLGQARDLYRDLAQVDQLTDYERQLGLDAAYYTAQVAELDAWAVGLERHDPAVTKALAQRYLNSQLPGPGVRDRGLQLMRQIADGGDQQARDDLMLMLRTGSGGVDKDLDGAGRLLVEAAQAGDTKAMERLADNHARGLEGFAVDYPAARRWTEAAIANYTSSTVDDAPPRIRKLRNDLAYFDRLEKHAGAPLLDAQSLAALGQQTSAQAHFEYAMQLLAAHGSARRAEAVARLLEASRLGHGDAAWRLVQIYEQGFANEVDPTAAIEQLQRAAANHQFDATRELAMRYEQGTKGLTMDLAHAITLYEEALAAGHDNRYRWNLDPDNFNHFKWLESRLRQARMKQTAQAGR